jgi:hypothetical protein
MKVQFFDFKVLFGAKISLENYAIFPRFSCGELWLNVAFGQVPEMRPFGSQ